jgi:hypothetical protein
MAGATRKQVEAALAREAAKLDKAHTGIHRFDPIQRTLRAGCNWTANFRAIGSRVSLDEMRDALERVQARFPVVDFGQPGGANVK